MNKSKLACLASLLAAGIVQASSPCDGFELKIKNKLADDLLVTSIVLNGVAIQPDGIQRVNEHTEQVFTVNNSIDSVPIQGELVLHTISLPSKNVKINFNLEHTGLSCEHNDLTGGDNDYTVAKMRLPGAVDYSISNK